MGRTRPKNVKIKYAMRLRTPTPRHKRLVSRSTNDETSSSRVQNENDHKCLIGLRDRLCGLYPTNPCLVQTNNGLHCTRTWHDSVSDFVPLSYIPTIDLTTR